MSASEAKKIERNSPFERGVATTGRQDREPSTDVHKPLGNPPTTLNHAADLEAARVTIHPVNDWSSQRWRRLPWQSRERTAKRLPPSHSRIDGGAL